MWPLLKRREIMRGDAVKYVAIGRSFLFEKTLFDELGDGLCNFRRPLLDVGVEHPPMKDAVDGVLSVRMPGQIIENFWSGRRKSGVRRAHIWGQSSPLARGVPCYFYGSTRTRIIISSPVARTSLPLLKMRSPREGLCPRPNANRHWIRESQRGQFCPTILANICRRCALTHRAGARTILSTLRRSFAR